MAIVAHVKWQVYEKTFGLSACGTIEMREKIHNWKIYIKSSYNCVSNMEINIEKKNNNNKNNSPLAVNKCNKFILKHIIIITNY